MRVRPNQGVKNAPADVLTSENSPPINAQKISGDMASLPPNETSL